MISPIALLDPPSHAASERFWSMAPKSTSSPASREETPSNVSSLRKPKLSREEAWSPSNPNFSPDVYYVRATDPSGLVGHVIPVKFPPEIANYLATVVQ